MNSLSIMQGRLSPPPSHRIQAFPWNSWEREFEFAAQIGYDGIEWLFEAEHYQKNPIWTSEGRGRMKELSEATGVRVTTLCADYFMVHPFYRIDEKIRLNNIALLTQLLCFAAEVGVKSILLPVLEEAEVRNEDEKKALIDSLQEPLAAAASCGVRLGLETELPGEEYLELVSRGEGLGVYYDTGNSRAKGFDNVSDIRLLGAHACGIHIKDRVVGGDTTFLGQGDCNYPTFFQELAAQRYAGPVTLQAAFNADFIDVAQRHHDYIRRVMQRAGLG
ncbi:MAG: sugar phosphate isomerase/epimerase [Pirellulales bacterium]|nr:sugar phosphate isomerase/epimerase [Pirellulales bacterium]